jgi:predicted PurR-regulated permease PerM
VIEHFQSHTRALAAATVIILAGAVVLYITREVSMPVIVALLLYMLLRPVTVFLTNRHVPAGLGAALVVTAALAFFAASVYFLADPAAAWLGKVPAALEKLQKAIKEPIDDLKDASGAVEHLINPSPKGSRPAGENNNLIGETLRSMALSVVYSLADFGWSIAIIFSLLFFLLMSGDILIANSVALLGSANDHENAVAIAARVQRDVSSYLLTVTLINSGLGVFIGLGMYLIGLPNAVLWGAIAALLNFIPYLGAIIGAAVVTIAGFMTFKETADLIMPGLVYITINSIEGQLVTPWIVSRRLSINPVIVFLSVVFWGWLWGTVGVVVAVPMLVCAKVICDGFEPLQPIGDFLDGNLRSQNASGKLVAAAGSANPTAQPARRTSASGASTSRQGDP